MTVNIIKGSQVNPAMLNISVGSGKRLNHLEVPDSGIVLCYVRGGHLSQGMGRKHRSQNLIIMTK